MRIAILLLVTKAALALPSVTLKTDSLTYVIESTGVVSAFVDVAGGKNYLTPGHPPFMTIEKDGKRVDATSVAENNDYLTIGFGDSGVTAGVRIGRRPQYLTFELTAISDRSVTRVELANLPLQLTQYVTRSLASCRNNDFAAAIIPLNLETHTYSESSPGFATLHAEADSRVRLEGAKVALLGSKTADLLSRIEQIEIENHLPHPTLAGVWARKSREMEKSYLFVDLSEETADAVLNYAKAGGFGYIVVFDGTWNESHGTYSANLSNFPHGDAGLKQISDRIHAAGLKFGMHVLDMVVAKTDPLVSPTPAQGFMMYPDRHRILAQRVTAQDTFIPTAQSPLGLLAKADKSRFAGRDLRIDDEIVTYDDIQTVPPYGFKGCIRGAHGTVAAAHAEGSPVDNFSEFIGYYRPDVKSALYDRVAHAEAAALDKFQFDYIYPDGTSENLGSWPDQPIWYANNLLTAKLFRFTQREVMFAHAPTSDYSWHVFSRGNTTDYVKTGIIEHFDRVSLAGAMDSVRELQPFEFGWFGFFTHTPDADATRPREMEYAWSKALAFGAAMSLETDKKSLDGNGRTSEIFSLIKNWESLKLSDYFSVSVREQLKAQGKEFNLQQTPGGVWQALPISYAPAEYVNPGQSWNFDNPYADQPARITVEARPTLADYGDSANLVLMKPGPLKLNTTGAGPLGSSSRETSGLRFKLESTSDHFTASAVNEGSNPQGWGCAEVILGSAADLTNHRALGTWVEGDESGAILHFVIEDSGRWSVRDYYVPLTFKGWKYIKLPESAKGEVYGFAFPYSTYWAIRQINFAAISRVYVFLTGVKSGASVQAGFRQLEALQESPLPLRNPTLRINGQSVTFPVEVESEGYLEYDGSSRIRVFDPNGFSKTEAAIHPAPPVHLGSNRIEFAPDGAGAPSEAARITLSVQGPPLR